MKTKQVFVPPSVRTSAERSLLSKAYEVYHFPEEHDRLDHSFSLSSEPDGPAPSFKPGSKVCLSYNKLVELYVVLAAARGRCSSINTKPTDTILKHTSTSCLPTLNTSSPYMYILSPISSTTTKLKAPLDLTSTKLIVEHHLVLPPLYNDGRIVYIPIIHVGIEIRLPVEIKKVERGLGLPRRGVAMTGKGEQGIKLGRHANKSNSWGKADAEDHDGEGGEGGNGRGSGDGVHESKKNGKMKAKGPEEDVWKYKFLHGEGWVGEEMLVELVRGFL